MFALRYRLASPDGYRIKSDDVDVGSVAKRTDINMHKSHWRWGRCRR
jgi:hypothetical protein